MTDPKPWSGASSMTSSTPTTPTSSTRSPRPQSLALSVAPSISSAQFPDWHQEVIELVAEGPTVVARFACSGTHRGPWQASHPPAAP